MADRILADVRKIMNWHAARSDEFRSPIVRGMARTKPAKRARERILEDDELRAVWKAAEEAARARKSSLAVFGYLVRFVLLTMTRRNEAARMVDTERSKDDWIIPGARYKTKLDHVIPLSNAARDLLASIPRIKGVKYVFSTGENPVGSRKGVKTKGGGRPIGGFSKFKEDFDKKCKVTGWNQIDTAEYVVTAKGETIALAHFNLEKARLSFVGRIGPVESLDKLGGKLRHALQIVQLTVDRVQMLVQLWLHYVDHAAPPISSG